MRRLVDVPEAHEEQRPVVTGQAGELIKVEGGLPDPIEGPPNMEADETGGLASLGHLLLHEGFVEFEIPWHGLQAGQVQRAGQLGSVAIPSEPVEEDPLPVDGQH
eukprot:11205916-Lingulodinium_polyedra.AAC.1